LKEYDGYFCQKCKAGKWSGDSAIGICIDCAVGKYSEARGSDEEADCINCPAGRYVDVAGSDELADCIGCVVGKYVEVAGSDALSRCIGCSEGRYIGVVGAASAGHCISCPAGRYVDVTGSTHGASDPLGLSSACVSARISGFFVLSLLCREADGASCLETEHWVRVLHISLLHISVHISCSDYAANPCAGGLLRTDDIYDVSCLAYQPSSRTVPLLT
jgi:hypothetical protein